MSRRSSSRSWFSVRRGRIAVALTALVAVGLTAACSGGSSDTAGGNANSGGGQLTLFAYSVAKPGYDKVITEFNKTEAARRADSAVLRRLR
ncbi:Uncharacterised protein [Nocardia africana]|uniref:Uncharacterized protein n=1 Tax=Nocardia africana TaxID=134964 RepID=A0A378X0L1_9NOCA|nr:Uncharacterised protein [Nocardia africana]